jgi:hypothetical protein
VDAGPAPMPGPATPVRALVAGRELAARLVGDFRHVCAATGFAVLAVFARAGGFVNDRRPAVGASVPVSGLSVLAGRRFWYPRDLLLGGGDRHDEQRLRACKWSDVGLTVRGVCADTVAQIAGAGGKDHHQMRTYAIPVLAFGGRGGFRVVEVGASLPHEHVGDADAPMAGDFASVNSRIHCIVVGSSHIGAGQGASGGLSMHVQSGEPSRSTVTKSWSTTVAVAAMWGGAARRASAIFSSVVIVLWPLMVFSVQGCVPVATGCAGRAIEWVRWCRVVGASSDEHRGASAMCLNVIELDSSARVEHYDAANLAAFQPAMGFCGL